MKDHYLSLLKKFYSDNNHLPTYMEMKSLFGLASTNSIFRYVQQWIEEGILEKHGKVISPTSDFFALPLLGSIRAGLPDMPIEIVEQKINLNDYLVNKSQGIFLVKVKGDSMIEAGIFEDDVALIDKEINPRKGNIVAACIDGQWTLKYFENTNGRVSLRAANGKYEDLYPRESLIIAGVLTGVIRKYYH